MTVAKTLLLGMVSCALMVSPSKAAQLLFSGSGPNQPNFDDSPLDVSYNSTSQSLIVSNWGYGGGSQYFNGLGASLFEYEDSSVLDATINSAGMLTGGTYDLYGNIGNGDDELLLSGTLKMGNSGTAWGYYDNNSSDQFTFLFTISGGDSVVVSDFGGAGATDGIQLTANFAGNSGQDVPFSSSGTWGGSFNNLDNNGVATGKGYADIYQVPEPSSVALMSVALPFLLLTYLRKSYLIPSVAKNNSLRFRSK